jgi:hypothetical protein
LSKLIVSRTTIARITQIIPVANATRWLFVPWTTPA